MLTLIIRIATTSYGTIIHKLIAIILLQQEPKSRFLLKE